MLCNNQSSLKYIYDYYYQKQNKDTEGKQEN